MKLLSIDALNSIKINTYNDKNVILVRYSKANLSLLRGLLKHGLIQNFTIKSKLSSILVNLKFDQNSNSAVNSFVRIAKARQNLKITRSNHFLSKTNFNVLFTDSKKRGSNSKPLDCLYFIK